MRRYAPGEIAKSLVTLGLGLTVILNTALSDGRLDGLEVLGVVVVLANGLVVFQVSNMPSGVLYWKKAICGAVGTSVAALVTALTGNVAPGVGVGELFAAVTPAQWYTLLFGVLTGVMVAVVPNAAASDGLIVHEVDDNYDDTENEQLSPEEEALLPSPEPDTHQGK